MKVRQEKVRRVGLAGRQVDPREERRQGSGVWHAGNPEQGRESGRRAGMKP